MSQTPGAQSGQTATERAEELVARAARGVGFFAGFTRLRIQQAAIYIRDEADRLDQPKIHQGEPPKSSTTTQAVRRDQPLTVQIKQSAAVQEKKPNGTAVVQTERQGQPVTQRAEVIVDDIGQRVGSFAAATSLSVQRAVARLREDTEDIWAEAQSIRHKDARTPQEV